MHSCVRDVKKKCEIHENSEDKSLLMMMYFSCRNLSYNMGNYDGGGGGGSDNRRPVSTTQLTCIFMYIRHTAKYKMYLKNENKKYFDEGYSKLMLNRFCQV